MRKQRQRYERRSFQFSGKQTHGEQADANDNQGNERKQKRFRKLAAKLMVDMKQVCCGETTDNFTITDSTLNAI